MSLKLTEESKNVFIRKLSKNIKFNSNKTVQEVKNKIRELFSITGGGIVAIDDDENFIDLDEHSILGSAVYPLVFEGGETRQNEKTKSITIKWIRSSFQLEIDMEINLDDLNNKIFDHWESLIRIDFILYDGDNKIDSNSKLLKFFNSDSSTITIESQAKGFSELKETDVFKWALIPNIEKEDSRFESIQIDLNNKEHDIIFNHVLLDLQYKNELYGPITSCVDSSVREFISSVILACAKISGDISLVTEMEIIGKRGNGPVDYAMLYKKYFIVITEAKKDNLEKGVVQNLAQLVASREEFLYNNISGLNKRKYMDYAADIIEIPSTGLVSTGKEWLLIRYVHYPKNAAYRSDPISLPLLGGSPEELKRHLMILISKILGAIDIQKKYVDSCKKLKVQKSDY